MKKCMTGAVGLRADCAGRGESPEEVSTRGFTEPGAARISTVANRHQQTKIGPPLTLGRREMLRAGLGGAAGLVAGLAFDGSATLAPQKVQDNGKRTPQYRVIDAHNHPRWIGHDGARIIEDMDAAGIERAWLLSWEIPERELDPAYYAKLNPTGVGIPFRDVPRRC